MPETLAHFSATLTTLLWYSHYGKVAHHCRYHLYPDRGCVAVVIEAWPRAFAGRYLYQTQRFRFLLPGHDQYYRFPAALLNFLDIQKVRKNKPIKLLDPRSCGDDTLMTHGAKNIPASAISLRDMRRGILPTYMSLTYRIWNNFWNSLNRPGFRGGCLV